MPPCHGGDRGFESPRGRQKYVLRVQAREYAGLNSFSRAYEPRPKGQLGALAGQPRITRGHTGEEFLMISTVTSTTVSTITSVALGATLGLVAVLLLIGFLVVKEL